jgi:hypothetical protein
MFTEDVPRMAMIAGDLCNSQARATKEGVTPWRIAA